MAEEGDFALNCCGSLTNIDRWSIFLSIDFISFIESFGNDETDYQVTIRRIESYIPGTFEFILHFKNILHYFIPDMYNYCQNTGCSPSRKYEGILKL